MKYIDQLFQRAPPVNKPWLLLQRVRTFFESELNCTTAELLRSHLLPFFRTKIRPDVMIGYAHVSGNLYLGMGLGNLTPTQSLIANVFSHGEIGLDFLCTTGTPQFTKEDELLLAQLATFKVLRVDNGAEIKARTSRTKEATISLDGAEEAVTKKRQEKGFRSFPLAKTLFHHPIEGSGNLLQHDAYLDDSWELEGDTEEEWLVSVAKHMRYQSYPSAEDGVGVCALYRGKLFSGSTMPAVSSIQMLGTSMLANGVHPSQIEKVCFAGKVDERIRSWNPKAEICTVEELQRQR